MNTNKREGRDVAAASGHSLSRRFPSFPEMSADGRAERIR